MRGTEIDTLLMDVMLKLCALETIINSIVNYRISKLKKS